MPERPENLFAEENASIENEEKGDNAEQPRSESLEQKESESLKERLGLIVRTISGKPELEVTTEVDPVTLMQMAMQGQDANRQWYQQVQLDPKTRKPIKELVHIPNEILENETEAKGKAAHEAGHVAITRMNFIPDVVMQETGFHSLLMASEERPTDQVVRERYAGAGNWVDVARKGSVAEGVERMETLKKQGIDTATLPKMPRFEQLANLMVYEPHYEEMPKDFDPEVIEAYEKVRDHIETIEHTLPAEGSEEKTIISKAKERYKILYKEVWPHMKKLVEKDIKDEALKQMKKNKPGSGQEGQGSGENKESRDELMKVFNALPKEVRNELIQKAIKIIEEIEDEIVKKMSGKLITGADTHKEFKAREEDEDMEKKRGKRSEEDAEKSREEIEKIEEKQEKLESNKNVYEKTYQEVRSLDEEVYARLQEVFQPNIKRTMRLSSSGSKINLPAVYRWTSTRGGGAKSIDNKIFEKVHNPEAKDYTFTLLVDLSGSMRGGKIQETFKAVVLLTEVLNRLGVQFELLGFQDVVIPFKNFGEDLNDAVRERISGMLYEVESANPGGNNEAGFNDDGPCLAEASDRLDRQPGKEKFLWVFSDGLPVGSRSDEDDLTNAVRSILQTTRQKLIGLGLGSGTEHVKNFYPTSLPNIDVKKLSEVLGDLLEDMIQNPQQYSYEKKT